MNSPPTGSGITALLGLALGLALTLLLITEWPGLVRPVRHPDSTLPDHVLLYKHIDHDCLVYIHADNTQTWLCDDGCSYRGSWKINIERALECPQEETNE
jgi:hypothetical protein